MPSVSSIRQISPLSDATTALDGAIATTLVKLASSNVSSKQFLPGSVLCVALEKKEASLWRGLEARTVELGSSTLHTLTCRVPTLQLGQLSAKGGCHSPTKVKELGDRMLDVFEDVHGKINGTYVIRLFPIQAILLILLVHLLLACSVAAPVRELILHIYKNPSLAEPKLARY